MIKASFDQNSNARKILLETGNSIITHIQDKGKWGKDFPIILMDLRNIYSVKDNNQSLFHLSNNQNLEAVNNRFNEELDDLKSGRLKSNEMLHLGKPLEILRASGLKNGEITITQRVLRDHLKSHNLTMEDLKGLAKAIQTPMLVYN
ncbi:MAG: hypothetical protein LBL24_08965 [Bacteroidales bacterium]|nr:hypothetical protein [Bacteroidales bacterium]